METTFGTYTVCFDGHLPIRLFASSFQLAVEAAMRSINLYCCPYTGEAPVTIHDLDAVFLP